jgi:hypothetical protein
MNTRLLALTALPVLVLAFLPADLPAADANYKTPKAVYDAWAKARKAYDVKAALDCLAPEALREAAAVDAIQAIALKWALGRGVPEMKKASTAVLEKHGLTAKVTEKIKNPFFNRYGTPKERETLGKLIKDPRAFIVELAEAQKKAVKDIKFDPPPKGGEEPKVTVSLTDVKITGDKATGVILQVSEPYHGDRKDPDALVVREKREKLSFVKGAKGWRIIPSYEVPKDKLVPVPKKDAKDKKDKDK